MNKPAPIERPRPEWGSDVIVDMLKAFEIEYVALNPGSSYRGLHDSLVNYGGNRMPEMILCPHEEIAVGVAHGYARAKGKPMAAAVHNVVGLQHASMAIYNAWCDRLPVIVLGGTGPTDTAHRRPRIDWVHTALVQGNLVRDFVKWDDQPGSVEAVPEAFIRAYRLATTDPMGPVYLCWDSEVQEKKLNGDGVDVPSLDRYPAPLPMQAPEEGFEKTIRWLLEAKTPVIIADWVGRREAGFNALGELAELLAIPVFDQWGRFNFPTDHPLNLTGMHEQVMGQADLLLVLDVPDLEGAVTKRDQEMEEAMAQQTRKKWDEKPVATSRLYSEMAELLKNEDWVLTNGTSSGRENVFFPEKKLNQILGKYKGGGLGYGLPASLGAALAHKGSDKLCVDLQPDGDMLFTASGLWTAAHHKIPLLIIVCSNHSYYNDEEHQERMAVLRGRPVENKTIGIRIEDPVVDFTSLARSYGVWGAGPVTEPGDLKKVLRDALKVVKEGKPALVDVACQMR